MTKYVIELGQSSKYEPDFLNHKGGGVVSWVRSTRNGASDTRSIENRIKEAQDRATHYKTKAQAEKDVLNIFGENFQFRVSERI